MQNSKEDIRQVDGDVIVVVLLRDIHELQNVLVLHWHVTLWVSIKEYQSVLFATNSIM